MAASGSTHCHCEAYAGRVRHSVIRNMYVCPGFGRGHTLTRRTSALTFRSPMTPSYVALSRFRIRNEMSEDVAAAFRERPHMVDAADGFVRMDVISPADDESEFWLITYWRDEASFRSWHRSHEYRDSHAGIPKGLKLDPAATQVRAFRYIAS